MADTMTKPQTKTATPTLDETIAKYAPPELDPANQGAGPASMEERMRWPHMTDEELERAIRRDPQTGEIDWSQFALPPLTTQEREEIQRHDEERWKGKEDLFEDDMPLEDDEMAPSDIDTRYTLIGLEAHEQWRFADAREYRRKSRLDAGTLDASKRIWGIENLLGRRNIENAVRKYGIRWINH